MVRSNHELHVFPIVMLVVCVYVCVVTCILQRVVTVDVTEKAATPVTMDKIYSVK